MDGIRYKESIRSSFRVNCIITEESNVKLKLGNQHYYQSKQASQLQQVTGMSTKVQFSLQLTFPRQNSAQTFIKRYLVK